MKDQLKDDVRRSILLGFYIRAWGVPCYRQIARRDDRAVEVYVFSAGDESRVNRFATIGLSGLSRARGASLSREIYLVLPIDNGGVTQDEAISFLLDVMVYSLRDDVRFEFGETIPATDLMPKSWKARALLIDEPRGEPEYLENVCIGDQRVQLTWVVPIYEEERALIIDEGLEAFDRAESASGESLADPNRASFIA